MTKKQIISLIFHNDTFALMGALVFLWFSIGSLVDYNYRLEDLSKHSAKVIEIDSVITKSVDKPLHKSVTKELRLAIDTEPNYFTAITKKDFGYITNFISIDDTVQIFTKKKVWGIFGLKKANDISHLIKGDTIVVDFEAYRQRSSGFFFLSLIAAFAFFAFYYFRTKKRYQDIISQGEPDASDVNTSPEK